MKRMLIALAVLALTVSVFAAPGDTLSTFQLAGTPASQVRGVDKDFDDGDIWAAGPAGTSNIQYCKFDQDDHSIVTAWRQASGQYWVFDIGYGYMQGTTKSLVMIDQNAPKIRVYDPATGAQLTTLPEAFTTAYTDGCGIDPTNYYIWTTGYYEAVIKKSNYPATTWTTWATNPATPPMGAAYGWGKVFILTTSSDYKVYQYNAETAALEQTYTLTSWGASNYIMGISAGRVDAVPTKGKMPAGNESVFIAVWNGAAGIYEVEIGDVYTAPGEKIVPTSLGTVKSMYR